MIEPRGTWVGAGLPRLLAAGPNLWLVALDELSRDATIDRMLSSEEAHRAQQFRFAHLERRYTAGRAALRMLLGAALGIEPAAVPLESGPSGKPQLGCPTRISFNLSHCDGLAVIALTTHGEIGIDVESVARVRDPYALAARFFDEHEATVIAQLPPGLATISFIRCWTAKEAVLKAIGVGLTQPLRSVVVDADPRASIRLRRVPGSQRPYDWSLQDLDLLTGRLRIAIAVRAAHAPRARVYRFDAT